MRDLEVLRYRQVRVEVARPGELVAALLAEAVYSGAEIGSEQAGCSRISGARSACLTSSSREARWYGDRRNVREAVVEAEVVPGVIVGVAIVRPQVEGIERIDGTEVCILAELQDTAIGYLIECVAPGVVCLYS